MTKYHQQAQARAAKRKTYRADLKQDQQGMFTLKAQKQPKKTPKGAD
jgi:hypothetical protein